MIALIVAVAENGIIGKNNDLIWYLPKDLQYFKKKTEGHAVIMGRKNFESIPEKFRPLPKRTNIVVTRNTSFSAEGVQVCNTIEAAIEYAKALNDTEPFIIGGGQIYKYCIEHNLVDRMYITEVHKSYDGDTYFPEFEKSLWHKVSEERYEKDDRHEAAFTFCVYDRK